MSDNLTNLNHKELTKKLQDKLKKLSFDNLESFTTEVTFTGNSDVTIPNKLTFIPSRYIIMNQTGQGTISKGNSTWTKSSLFLKLEANVTSYRLSKTFTTISVPVYSLEKTFIQLDTGETVIEDINLIREFSSFTILENIDLVPAEQNSVTATITFLK